MTSKLTVDLAAPSASTTGFVVTMVAFTDWSLAVHGRRVPPSIPADQQYFWLDAWQLGEAETDEDIAAGDTEVFDNPQDAIRWLLSD